MGPKSSLSGSSASQSDTHGDNSHVDSVVCVLSTSSQRTRCLSLQLVNMSKRSATLEGRLRETSAREGQLRSALHKPAADGAPSSNSWPDTLLPSSKPSVLPAVFKLRFELCNTGIDCAAATEAAGCHCRGCIYPLKSRGKHLFRKTPTFCAHSGSRRTCSNSSRRDGRPRFGRPSGRSASALRAASRQGSAAAASRCWCRSNSRLSSFLRRALDSSALFLASCNSRSEAAWQEHCAVFTARLSAQVEPVHLHTSPHCYVKHSVPAISQAPSAVTRMQGVQQQLQLIPVAGCRHAW